MRSLEAGKPTAPQLCPGTAVYLYRVSLCTGLVAENINFKGWQEPVKCQRLKPETVI